MDKPLSNFDLNNMMMEEIKEKCNIFETADITKKTTKEDLFKNSGHVVFFHRWKKNDYYSIGHWVVLTRNLKKDGTVDYIFFDSLGKPINTYSKYLVDILKKKGDTMYINEKAYQGKTNCCGKWCLLMIGLNKKKHKLNISQLRQFLEEGKKKYGSYDKFILNIIK